MRIGLGKGFTTCIVSAAVVLVSPAVAGARPIDLSIGLAGQVTGQTIAYQVQPVLLPENNPKNTPKIKDITTDLRVDLPSGVAFDTFQDTQGFSCSFDPNGPGGSGSVFCTGPLNFRSSVDIRFTATITAASGTTLTTFAIIDPNNQIAEFDETDNTAEISFAAP